MALYALDLSGEGDPAAVKAIFEDTVRALRTAFPDDATATGLLSTGVNLDLDGTAAEVDAPVPEGPPA